MNFRSLLATAIFLISIGSIFSQAPFTFGSINNSFSITCNNPILTMTTGVTTHPTSYTWTSSSNTITGSTVNISQAGNWTITAQNNFNQAISQQTFNVLNNFLSPTVAVTPTISNVECSTPAVTFTGTSNLGPNVSTNFYRFVNTTKVYVSTFQGTVNLFKPTLPGVYWFESVNNDNGCLSTFSVQATSSVGVPVFSVVSGTGFTLDCGTNTCITVQIPMVQTSPIPFTPATYTFVPQSVTTTPTTFTFNPTATICTPGLWKAYVRDQTNACVSSFPFLVVQNTVQPNVTILQPGSVLGCGHSSMVISAISTNTNTTISWTVPALPTPTVLSASNFTVNGNPSAPNATTSVISLGIYTVGIVDNITNCSNTKTINIVQDYRPPFFSIGVVANSVVPCTNPTVTLIPNMTATLSTALSPTYSWTPPSGPIAGPQNSYNATLAGLHTSTALSTVNGCTETAVYTVTLNNTPTGASNSLIPAVCPVNTISISPNYTSSVSNYTFSWTGPAGSIVGATNQSVVVGNSAGVYTCAITNTTSGCQDVVTCTVTCSNGLLSKSYHTYGVSVYPNPSKGFINIAIDENELSAMFYLYDLQGKLQLQKELSKHLTTLDLKLVSGIYFYTIKSNDRVYVREKLIIE